MCRPKPMRTDELMCTIKETLELWGWARLKFSQYSGSAVEEPQVGDSVSFLHLLYSYYDGYPLLATKRPVLLRNTVLWVGVV